MLIIFDLDGVLIEASWEGLFEAYKIMILTDGKDYRDFFRDLSEFKKWWKPDWKLNNKRICLKSIDCGHRIFYDIYNKYVGPFPWLGKTIDELLKKNDLAICTNRHRIDINNLLDTPAREKFCVIIGGEDVVNLKPDPEGINLILEKSGVRPRDAIFIGDMPEDILAGKAAGVETGAVLWGLGDFPSLSAVNPDRFFLRPQELRWL